MIRISGLPPVSATAHRRAVELEQLAGTIGASRRDITEALKLASESIYSPERWLYALTLLSKKRPAQRDELTRALRDSVRIGHPPDVLAFRLVGDEHIPGILDWAPVIDWASVIEATRKMAKALAELPDMLERRQRISQAHREYRRRQQARRRRDG